MEKSKMRIRDMTEGSPLKLILGFAVPMLIGNVFQQIYTIADTMVVGRKLGDPAIAAVGATSSLYSLIVNLASGMNSGYGIVVTQAFGAHDEKKLRRSIAGMSVLNVAITLILTALSLIFMRPLLRFMNTPEDIFEKAYIYIAVICGGMISTVLYNMFAAVLRAVGNSRSPLYFLIISCVLNVALDILAVSVLEWGVTGAAAATVTAQSISAVLCGVYLIKNYRAILPKKEDFLLSKDLISELLSTGFAMALMLCVVDLGSIIFQRANNLLGETIITAHTASRRIITIMMQPIGTIATANSTFVAQNWGAKKPERIRDALKKVLCVELLYSVAAAAVIWLFGGALVRFTTGTNDAETVKNAVMSLRCHLSLFPVLSILLCLRTTMQAMGYKTAPVFSSCIELAMKIVSAWLLIPNLGFFGTSITEPITWVFMTIFLTAAYLSVRKKLFGEKIRNKSA